MVGLGLGLGLGSGLGLIRVRRWKSVLLAVWQLLVVGSGRDKVSRRVRAVAVTKLGLELA